MTVPSQLGLLQEGLETIQMEDEGPIETEDWSLTWGFEFELLLAYPVPDNMDDIVKRACDLDPSLDRFTATWRVRHEAATAAQTRMLEMLRSAKVEMNNLLGDNEISYDSSKWTICRDGSVQATEDEHNNIHDHMFENGQVFSSIVDASTRLDFIDVELVSRVLPGNADSLNEVRYVLEIVKMFPTKINESCGFHVHIGNRSKGFEENTVKNLMSLLTTAQYQFNELHAEHRLTSEYCIMLDRAFEREDRDPQTMTLRIEELPGLQAVVKLFTTNRSDRTVRDHNWVVNLANLTGRPDRRTIEWRQHEGTLDFQRVWNWILLASLIMCKSNQRNNPYYGLELYVNKNDYSVLDLFTDMNLHPCNLDFAGKTHNYPRPYLDSLPDPFA